MRFLALFLTFFFIGCGSGISADTKGVPLAFGLTSFSSKSAVLAKFNQSHRTEVTEDSSLPPGDSRPPFSIYTVQVHQVSHKGFPGQVRLSFFNDRLMGVWFYPDDVAAYRSATNPVGSSHDLSRHVESWTAEDYRGKWYIAWEDKRLLDQSRDWIDRYAESSERQFRKWA